MRELPDSLNPDGKAGKTSPRRLASTNAYIRVANRAVRIAVEGVGTTARVDTGERTSTQGRVLEVGTVVSIWPVLYLKSCVRNRLRMIRPDGRTVERLVNVVRVHRWNEGRAE